MPKMVCQGLASIHPRIVRQLATRPESTPSVAVKKYSADPERRIQYISAKAGKTRQTITEAAAAATTRTGTTRAKRTRCQLRHTSTRTASTTVINEAREYDSTSAAVSTAPPTKRPVRETGDSERGRESATAIITRKKAQKLPSV